MRRSSNDSLQCPAQLSAFVRLEVTEPACRVEHGSPQHLIGKHVAQTGDDALVHQHGLQRPVTAVQTLLQERAAKAEGVGALLADHLPDSFLTVGQPNAAELALIPEHEFPAPHTDDHPVETETPPVRRLPYEATGHPEVEQNRRAVCRGQQPLPAPGRLTEPSALKLIHEGRARQAPNHARVSNLDRRDPSTDDMSVEQTTEPLDVGQLGHGPNLPWQSHQARRAVKNITDR